MDIDMILDLEEDHRRCDEERSGQQAPAGGKLAHVADLKRIDPAGISDGVFSQWVKLDYLPPSDGRTCRLDALVETSVVSQLTTIVAERTHVPA